MLRLIGKWLRAGVSEEGQWSRTKVGTPQGAVISPLLANIYLHYVLDLWVDNWRKKVRGDVIIVRYADDWITGFQDRDDAQLFLQQLEERLAKFGLEMQPEKTRLIEFGRFAISNRKKGGEGKPETFDFLGFTHICATAIKTKRFVVRRKTIAKRLREKLKEVREEIIKRMHVPVPEQGRWLRSVINGHFNYYGVPGNGRSLNAFRTQVIRSWFWALRHRSHKARSLTWDRFKRLVSTWIPTAKVRHPYPNERLHVSYPR